VLLQNIFPFFGDFVNKKRKLNPELLPCLLFAYWHWQGFLILYNYKPWDQLVGQITLNKKENFSKAHMKIGIMEKRW